MALCGSGAARLASEDEQRPDELAVPEAAQRGPPGGADLDPGGAIARSDDELAA
jgi:hypothetical protein